MGFSDVVAATLLSIDILRDVQAGQVVGTLEEAGRFAK